MTNTVTEDIQKIIAQNLPAATAGELSKYIEESEGIKDDLEEARLKIVAYRKLITNKDETTVTLNAQIGILTATLDAHEELALREEKICIKERDLELTLARIRLEASEDRAASLFSLVDKVFSVPSVTVKNSSDAVLQHSMVDGSAYQTTQPSTATEVTTNKRE